MPIVTSFNDWKNQQATQPEVSNTPTVNPIENSGAPVIPEVSTSVSNPVEAAPSQPMYPPVGTPTPEKPFVSDEDRRYSGLLNALQNITKKS